MMRISNPSKQSNNSLIIYCNVCYNQIINPGALLFSPPIKGQCNKYHICIKCYKDVMNVLKLTV